MKVLVMNCSPVRNGATAEIVNIVTDCLEKKHDVKNICIDDYDIKFCKDVYKRQPNNRYVEILNIVKAVKSTANIMEAKILVSGGRGAVSYTHLTPTYRKSRAD